MKYDQVQMYILEMIIQIRFKLLSLYLHLVKCSYNTWCLFADNGPHYHNTPVLLYLAEVNSSFNIRLLEYNNFEAEEGKTVLDTHFAHVSHKIVCWVRVGNDLDTGE